jgi:two-component system cell cycle response regulator
MKVIHLALDSNIVEVIRFEVENRHFYYNLVDLNSEAVDYDSLFEYNLIIIDSQNSTFSSESIVKYIVNGASTPIPIIIISDEIDFIIKTQLYDLGIMTVINKTGFNPGRFGKYLDTIEREKRTIQTLRNMRIAVIDDSRFSLAIIRAYFEKFGILNIDYFLDASDFLKQQDCYDLYLVDLVMPHHNGEDIIYHIRQLCNDAIIILITTYGEGKAIGHCLTIGADDYILKPLDFKLFMLRLYTCINNFQITKEHIQINENLYRLATKDALTDLYNRAFFIEAFEHKKKESQRSGLPFSLVLFDLDHFKQINDEYGHQKGDVVLRATSDTVKSRLRGSDIICRWGGEEFCVLLPNTFLDDATQVAQIIRQSIEDMKLDGIRTITASFGVTAWQPEDTYETMFRRVDNSLYLAKLTGRNNVITNDELYIQRGGLPMNIEWGPFFKSGHPQVDAEHFELIRLCNSIIVQCFTEQNKEKTTTLFNKLIAHIVKHFKNEELILEEFHYKGLDEHKRVHQDLLNKSLLFQKKLTLGDTTSIDIAKYIIQDVVVGHIIKSDFDFYHIFPQNH